MFLYIPHVEPENMNTSRRKAIGRSSEAIQAGGYAALEWRTELVELEELKGSVA